MKTRISHDTLMATGALVVVTIWAGCNAVLGIDSAETAPADLGLSSGLGGGMSTTSTLSGSMHGVGGNTTSLVSTSSGMGGVMSSTSTAQGVGGMVEMSASNDATAAVSSTTSATSGNTSASTTGASTGSSGSTGSTNSSTSASSTSTGPGTSSTSTGPSSSSTTSSSSNSSTGSGTTPPKDAGTADAKAGAGDLPFE